MEREQRNQERVEGQKQQLIKYTEVRTEWYKWTGPYSLDMLFKFSRWNFLIIDQLRELITYVYLHKKRKPGWTSKDKEGLTRLKLLVSIRSTLHTQILVRIVLAITIWIATAAN